MARKTYFNPQWLSMPSFEPWLEKKVGFPNEFQCKLCHRGYSLSNMGTTALSSHMKGEKHLALLRCSQHSIKSHFPMLKECGGETSQQAGTLASTSATLPQCSSVNSINSVSTSASLPQRSSVNSESSLSQRLSTNPVDEQSLVTEAPFRGKATLHAYSVSEGVSKAEILWCIQSVMSHKSLRVAASDVSLFPMLFPDSEIATNMRLQKDKISYISVYGLHPYFFDQLVFELNQQEWIVLGFDESFNKISKNCQMDINVRFWCDKKVVTRYYSSAFLGKTTAPDLLKAFNEAISRIDGKKIIQVSIDGPNVNFKFIELFQKYLGEDEEDVILLNLGSCGLHTVHNSFKTGLIAAHWLISAFLRALYNLFKESPARRAQFFL